MDEAVPGHQTSWAGLGTDGLRRGTGNMVLFGGDSRRGLIGDTWVWNGSGWVRQAPATSPQARWDSSIAYDATTGNLVLFGGRNSNSLALRDTWVWNGSDWVKQAFAASPPARALASMDWDAATATSSFRRRREQRSSRRHLDLERLDLGRAVPHDEPLCPVGRVDDL